MRLVHGDRSPSPRLARGPTTGGTGASLAGGWKTMSVAAFVFFVFFFGRRSGGLGSVLALWIGVGGRIATTAGRHELFGARTPAKRWRGKLGRGITITIHIKTTQNQLNKNGTKWLARQRFAALLEHSREEGFEVLANHDVKRSRLRTMALIAVALRVFVRAMLRCSAAWAMERPLREWHASSNGAEFRCLDGRRWWRPLTDR